MYYRIFLFIGRDIKLKLDLDKISKSAPDTKVGTQPITPLPESQPIAQQLEHSRVVNDNHSRDEIITKLDIDIEDKINDLVITEDNASPIEIDKEIRIENEINNEASVEVDSFNNKITDEEIIYYDHPHH